jgi:hypothetical protein
MDCCGRCSIACSASSGQHDTARCSAILSRDGDLEPLLGDAQDEATGSAEDFAQLVQSCVAHLELQCRRAGDPDRNIAVCRTGEGTPPRIGAELLTQTHRPLLAWTVQQRQSLVANDPARPGVLARVPYKVLCCPVMQGAQRVLGMLALFKPQAAPDFDLRQVRSVELLATTRGAHPAQCLRSRNRSSHPPGLREAGAGRDASRCAGERELRDLRRHRPLARPE